MRIALLILAMMAVAFPVAAEIVSLPRAATDDGTRLTASLNDVDGTLHVLARVRGAAKTKVALWAATEAAWPGGADNDWEVIAQDTTGLAVNDHRLEGDSSWNVEVGDDVHLVANLYTAADVFIETVYVPTKATFTGDHRTWIWCAHDLPADAVAEGWIFGAADTSQYHRVINAVTDGGGIRYCFLERNDPRGINFDGELGQAAGRQEDDATSWPTGTMLTGIHYTIDIPKYSKVDEAFLILTTPNGTGQAMDINGGDYISARMDTTYEAWASAAGYGGDDLLAAVGWEDIPHLEAMDDWHDLGPRGGASNTSDVAYGGQSVKIDVTDAVQQYLDRGAAGVNGGFWPYASRASADGDCINFSLGPNGDHGTPVLVVKWRHGVYNDPPWGRPGLPFVITMDDSYIAHLNMWDLIREAGGTYTEMVCYAFTPAGDNGHHDVSHYTGAHLHDLLEAGVDFCMHTDNHSMASENSGWEQNADWIRRDWLDEVFTVDAPIDVDDVQWADFAWTAGGGPPFHDAEAMDVMIGEGYRSARSYITPGSAADAMGPASYLSWTEYSNLFVLGRLAWDDVGDTYKEHEYLDGMGDVVDDYYTNHGAAAIIVMLHSWETFGGWSESRFPTVTGVVAQLDCVWFANLEDVVTMRLEAGGLADAHASFAHAAYLDGYSWQDSVYAAPVDLRGQVRPTPPTIELADPPVLDVVVTDQNYGAMNNQMEMSLSFTADRAVQWHTAMWLDGLQLEPWRPEFYTLSSSGTITHTQATTPDVGSEMVIGVRALVGGEWSQELVTWTVTEAPPDVTPPTPWVASVAGSGNPVDLTFMWGGTEESYSDFGWDVNGGAITWTVLDVYWDGSNPPFHMGEIVNTGNASSSGDVYNVWIRATDMSDNTSDPVKGSSSWTVP